VKASNKAVWWLVIQSMVVSAFILGVTAVAYMQAYEVPLLQGINAVDAGFTFILVSFYLFFMKYSIERARGKLSD